MFRLTCFVDDKNLALVLRALASVGAREVNTQPVAEANTRGKQLVAQPSGSNGERFVAEWKRRKLTTIDAAQAKELALAIGMSQTSYSHVLHNAVHAGLIVKAGNKPGNKTAYIYKLKEKAK